MKRFLAGLPTEFQFSLIMGLMGVSAWALSSLDDGLEKGLDAILTLLGSLAGGALAHGGFSRFGKPDSNKDLMGDVS